MASSLNLWKAWNAAKTWKSRPSEIYKIEEEYGEFAAFCFDSAVATFGQALEAALQKIDGKTTKEIESKRKQVFDRWIPELKPRAGTQKFRDPMEKASVGI